MASAQQTLSRHFPIYSLNANWELENGHEGDLSKEGVVVKIHRLAKTMSATLGQMP
jgi:hypothetical protein